MVTGAEARAPALNVYVSPNPEVVQGVGEEYPFILRSKIGEVLIQIIATIQSHLHFEYSASQASVVLIVFSAKQVPHPEMFNEVRNSFGGELK